MLRPAQGMGVHRAGCLAHSTPHQPCHTVPAFPTLTSVLTYQSSFTSFASCQVEASSKVKELFPNLADVPTVDLTTAVQDSARTADKEAMEMGKPFMQLAGFGDGDGDEEEWVGWLNWDGLGGSSSA